MPKPTKYWYWQIRPYHPVYWAYLSLGDMVAEKNRIARVERVRSTWYAGNFTDPDASGEGKTRDAAVDDFLEEIGGLG